MNGIEEVVESRFNLVDLAGSERQQSTGTVGVRLKEAGNINKSLLALANVINSLSDNQQQDANNTPNKHIQYRDSKLTFLLRDSLGGNSRTAVIACVSPSWSCQGESLSTLRFAKRAKMIKNKAIVNQDIHGSLEDMRAEIKRLQAALEAKDQQDREERQVKIDGPVGVFVAGVLKRCREFEEQTRVLRRRCVELEELSRRREQQLNSERLIVKLRDNALQALKSHLPLDYQQAMDEIAGLRRQLEEPSAESLRLAATVSDLQSQLSEARAEQCMADRQYILGLEELLMKHDNTDASNSEPNIAIQPITTHEHDNVDNEKVANAHNHDADRDDDDVDFLQQQIAIYKEDAVQSKKKYDQAEQHLLSQLAMVKEQLVQLQEQLGRSAADHEMRAMELQSQLSKQHDTIKLMEFKLISAQQDNESLLSKLSLLNMPTSDRIAQLTADNHKLQGELDKMRATLSRHTATTGTVKIKQENMELKAALTSAKEQITLLSSMLSAR